MNAIERSDKELVESYLSGNQASFEILLSRHQSRVFSYILMLVRDRQLADDIFQDTFIKVIRTLHSGTYNEEGKFIQWVMRIAHNLIIDHFRKAKRLPTVDGGGDEVRLIDRLGHKDASVEEKLVNDQIHEHVRKMIDFLPEEQREVLYLRMYADMSFKEIAELTNVSINTALGRMRYALLNLRKMAREKNLTLSY
ncbi:MAG TPA: sigma-70 family RNA polymerase sigma factor [Bacteroidales bacterium]|mgnify:FL=1|nr:sigma-70 family RNA polymerase sigma factor [Bacteroidales bacterium]